MIREHIMADQRLTESLRSNTINTRRSERYQTSNKGETMEIVRTHGWKRR